MAGSDKVDWEERARKALDVANYCAGYDGAPHKDYCIDRMVRALCGGRLADNMCDVEATDEYEEWVDEYECEGGDERIYNWIGEEAVAP